MQIEQLAILIRQQMAGALSAEDHATLDAFIADEANRELVIAAFVALISVHPAQDHYHIDRFSPLLKNVLGADQLPEQPATPVRPVPRILLLRKTWVRYAAILLAIMVAGIAWLWLHRAPSPSKEAVTEVKETPVAIEPGRNGAVLTLGDGRQVELDSVGNSTITTQGNTILLLKNGALTYQTKGKSVETMVYNTMTTPRGKEFQVVLPDGTRVWLNAASSIRYPVSFSSLERRVEVTGEAYFEVTKNASVPFYVSVNGRPVIEVLGTHFNVNAYDDEANLKVTLLEGSVRVRSEAGNQPSARTGKGSVVLKPGQQAQLEKQGAAIKVIDPADIVQAVAWKNGSFAFNEADLPTVMRQLARWYNVDVEYAGAIPPGKFNGEIGKKLTLEQVLKGLTNTSVKYRIEKGNKIIIQP